MFVRRNAVFTLVSILLLSTKAVAGGATFESASAVTCGAGKKPEQIGYDNGVLRTTEDCAALCTCVGDPGSFDVKCHLSGKSDENAKRKCVKRTGGGGYCTCAVSTV